MWTWVFSHRTSHTYLLIQSLILFVLFSQQILGCCDSSAYIAPQLHTAPPSLHAYLFCRRFNLILFFINIFFLLRRNVPFSLCWVQTKRGRERRSKRPIYGNIYLLYVISLRIFNFLWAKTTFSPRIDLLCLCEKVRKHWFIGHLFASWTTQTSSIYRTNCLFFCSQCTQKQLFCKSWEKMVYLYMTPVRKKEEERWLNRLLNNLVLREKHAPVDKLTYWDCYSREEAHSLTHTHTKRHNHLNYKIYSSLCFTFSRVHITCWRRSFVRLRRVPPPHIYSFFLFWMFCRVSLTALSHTRFFLSLPQKLFWTPSTTMTSHRNTNASYSFEKYLSNTDKFSVLVELCREKFAVRWILLLSSA